MQKPTLPKQVQYLRQDQPGYHDLSEQRRSWRSFVASNPDAGFTDSETNPRLEPDNQRQMLSQGTPSLSPSKRPPHEQFQRYQFAS